MKNWSNKSTKMAVALLCTRRDLTARFLRCKSPQDIEDLAFEYSNLFNQIDFSEIDFCEIYDAFLGEVDDI